MVLRFEMHALSSQDICKSNPFIIVINSECPRTKPIAQVSVGPDQQANFRSCKRSEKKRNAEPKSKSKISKKKTFQKSSKKNVHEKNETGGSMEKNNTDGELSNPRARAGIRKGKPLETTPKSKALKGTPKGKSVAPKRKASKSKMTESTRKTKRGIATSDDDETSPSDLQLMARVLGCSRCRYISGGCQTCRRPGFKPRGKRAPKSSKEGRHK